MSIHNQNLREKQKHKTKTSYIHHQLENTRRQKSFLLPELSCSLNEIRLFAFKQPASSRCWFSGWLSRFTTYVARKLIPHVGKLKYRTALTRGECENELFTGEKIPADILFTYELCVQNRRLWTECGAGGANGRAKNGRNCGTRGGETRVKSLKCRNGYNNNTKKENFFISVKK